MTGMWRRLGTLGRIVVPLVLVAVIVAATLVVIRVVGCGGGLSGAGDGGCVGVTDGSDPAAFGEEFRTVLGAIGTENESTSGRPSVSVAYALPIPPQGSTDATVPSLRHELVGAYLAQRRANAAAGDAPRIRLLVAGTGIRSEHAADVLGDLIPRATSGSDHLVSVVVTGKSTRALGDAVAPLLRAGVPVVSSRLTADDLVPAGEQYQAPLARVVPTNADQAAAAAAYLKPTTRTAMIVQNMDTGDSYASSLGGNFTDAYRDDTHTIVRTKRYGGKDGVATAMAGAVRDICDFDPDTVFFAGRAVELDYLVKELPDRACPKKQVRIVTGPDTVDFATFLAGGPAPVSPSGPVVQPAQDENALRTAVRAGMASGVEVVYTGLAHPGEWARPSGSFDTVATNAMGVGTCPTICLSTVAPLVRNADSPDGEKLDDGGVIVGHDAVLTTIRAVRAVTDPEITPGAVGAALRTLHGKAAVPGASGWISISEQTGQAQNKATPLIGVAPEGTLAFIGIEAPLGGDPCALQELSECRDRTG